MSLFAWCCTVVIPERRRRLRGALMSREDVVVVIVYRVFLCVFFVVAKIGESVTACDVRW